MFFGTKINLLGVEQWLSGVRNCPEARTSEAAQYPLLLEAFDDICRAPGEGVAVPSPYRDILNENQ
jgi:hypothetical protein